MRAARTWDPRANPQVKDPAGGLLCVEPSGPRGEDAAYLQGPDGVGQAVRTDARPSIGARGCPSC